MKEKSPTPLEYAYHLINQNNPTTEEIVQEVSDFHNNPSMAGWLRLYVEVIQRSGFKIIRSEPDETKA